MKNKYTIFSIFIILAFSSSCYIRAYEVVSESKRSWREAPELMESTKNSPPLCTATYQEKRPLQIIVAQDLKNCLKDNSKAIVYKWSTRCKGDACYLPDVLQAWCTEQEIDLYVIAEFYDHAYIKRPYKLEKPILAIDHKYYKTPWVAGYSRKFYKELIGRKQNKKIEGGRLLFFEHGEFKGYHYYLKDLPITTSTANQ